MRWQILTILILVIISTLIIPNVNAARINCILGDGEAFEQCQREHGRCYQESSSGGQNLVCWIENEEAAPAEEPEVELEIPTEQPQPEEQREPLPEGLIANAQKVNDREIAMSVENRDREKANLILRLIGETIGGTDDLIYKPRLDINFDIKKVINIPPLVDVKLIPYILYTLIVLSAGAFLLIIFIIKDVVEPKWKL